MYKRFYPATITSDFSNLQEFRRALRGKYDVVHLFCFVPASGVLTDNDSIAMTGTELIEACSDVGVKLLWIASENTSDSYIKAFNARARRINLVMTVRRNGPKFPMFLDRLLSRMSSGDTMPASWVALAPQAEGPWEKDLPGCIFFAQGEEG